MVNNEEDDAEVINPYEEADPHNRPPPTSDEETEFAPLVVHIDDANDVPIPLVIQFGSNFHVGESSATRDLIAGISEVYAPGLMCCALKNIHRGVMKLSKQMHDMYMTEKKMARKLRQDELHMNGKEFDITALDSTVRENRFENSKMMKLITGLSREFTELKNQNRRAEELSQIIPLKRRSQTNPQPTLTQEAIDHLVRDGIEATIRAERERVIMEATRAGGPAGGPSAAPMARECLFAGFMKCGPTQFHGTEGAVGLVPWFEKIENTFLIIPTLGRQVENGRPWTEVKQMMTDEFCPTKEVQRLEDKLRHLKLRDMNIAAYTERFNELSLLCTDVVHNEKKKVELYIKGLPEIIKGETTSSRPVTLNEAVCMAQALMEQKIQAKNERIAEGLKRKRMGHKAEDCRSKNMASSATIQPNVVCYECRERGHKIRACPKKADRRGRNVQGQAYVIRDAEHNQGPNVVTVKLNSSYEVELANGKVVSTNTVLRGCTLNLLDHLFDIDLMPIELGTFDVIVGMDWLVERDVLIVCGKKEVHVSYKNKTLVVKSDSSVSRLKRMQAAQDRQKNYADRKRKLMEFKIEDRVMLKVSPWKRGCTIRVHHTLHVSNLKKCYSDEPLVMPLEGVHIDDTLQFMEEPVEIMEWEIKRLKRSRIPLVKVRWNSRRGPEFTWEREDSFKKKYPHLFTSMTSSSTT
nr:putative reverse transcriptase domain-containing protein [Tanacetum cinerariifolium]